MFFFIFVKIIEPMILTNAYIFKPRNGGVVTLHYLFMYLINHGHYWSLEN